MAAGEGVDGRGKLQSWLLEQWVGGELVRHSGAGEDES